MRVDHARKHWIGVAQEVPRLPSGNRRAPTSWSDAYALSSRSVNTISITSATVSSRG